MAGRRLLATGVTGYMGGSFLAQLLASNDPNIQGLSFSALVRKQEQADVLAKQGVNAIVFRDLDDGEFLKSIASEHDIVIHSANGFHTPSAKALIEGLAERKQKTGREVYYLQTSGTSNLGDHPITKRYLHPESRVFSDTEDIYQYMAEREALEVWGQRTTDLAVVRIGKAAGVKTYVIISPTVYGVGLGSFNKRSIQVPLLIRAALATGTAPYIGDGRPEWDHAHIADLSSMYEIVVAKILAGEGIPSGEQGVYFATAGRHTWRALSEAVGQAGHELGALETAAAASVTLEEFARAWSGGSAQFAELGFASR
ncbi:hypothetical protein B0H67DRAFT_587348 [Lasiosphaeris hirsuta]|uniref:NAD-dependent epimerase/dehydratase domain-containing protein n=1 Tax=Lasiosphaeris hirsuta TaxID=260670 RepID=A0AA40A148_9PEZI|nr:hypothetical protein B0H67DRAFT_587348 [Lasiosphaeris hirsuta]